MGKIPLSKLQLGAHGPQSDKGISHLAAVMASPCDQQAIFSAGGITGVANLATKDMV